MNSLQENNFGTVIFLFETLRHSLIAIICRYIKHTIQCAFSCLFVYCVCIFLQKDDNKIDVAFI